MEHHFDVQEAVIYGVEKAVMLNNFRFWLTKNRATTIKILMITIGRLTLLPPWLKFGLTLTQRK